MKFSTKAIRQYPPHLRHVVTLPWEITNLNAVDRHDSDVCFDEFLVSHIDCESK